MQERYLGDGHDFIKYAVLKALHHALGGPVGLNWYLTHPDAVDHPSKNDGEKRHHLTQSVWHECDPSLIDAMAQFADPTRRSIEAFESSGVLPNDTRFVSEPVPPIGPKRTQWHKTALEHLAPCSAVFLDPDNGFQVHSMTRKRSPKYALFEEASAYRKLGQVVVTIQFAPRRPITDVASEMLARHRKLFPEDAALPILRGRSSPNILLQLAAPPDRHVPVIAALDALVTRLPGKLEWVKA